MDQLHVGTFASTTAATGNLCATKLPYRFYRAKQHLEHMVPLDSTRQ